MQKESDQPAAARIRHPRPSLALLAALLLTGCTSGATQPYAVAYQKALIQYPGNADVPAAAMERFVHFFSSETTSAEAARTEAQLLYSDRLYFSDTLLTSEDKAQVVKHLTRMHASTDSLSVTLLDTQRDGADFYLIWRMTAAFSPVRGTVTSHTIGVTHLRFDPDQRIVLQQDFWDAGAGFYEHIPLLGNAMRAIRASFDD